MKTIAMMCALAGGLALWSQDPVKPKSEPSEVQGVPERDPLEGVYKLLNRTVNGVPDPNPSRGYVAITRRHMLICFAGAGPDPDYPLLRAGVRSWEKRKEGLATVMQLGFYTDEEGEIHVEEPGRTVIRRIQLIRGMLRVWQDGQSYLTFERVE